jgi:hypothetical protein
MVRFSSSPLNVARQAWAASAARDLRPRSDLEGKHRVQQRYLDLRNVDRAATNRHGAVEELAE